MSNLQQDEVTEITEPNATCHWWQRPLEEIETDAILRMLDECHGSKPEAAFRLKISLKTIYNRLNRIQIREKLKIETESM